MKAVFHFNAGEFLRSELSRWDDPTVTFVDEADKEGLLRELSTAEVLLHVLRPVTAAIINAAPNLRLIQKIGVGINTIDIDAARAAGIAVANMPGTNTQAVAEHAVALMLATLRRIVTNHQATMAGGGWSLLPSETELSGELGGRTIGLVGFGAVPQRMATLLQAFGARVFFLAGPLVRLASLTICLSRSFWRKVTSSPCMYLRRRRRGTWLIERHSCG